MKHRTGIVLSLVLLMSAATTYAQPECLDKAQKALHVDQYRIALSLLQDCDAARERMDRLRGIAYYHLYKPDSAIMYSQKAYEAGLTDDTLLLSFAQALLWKKNFKTTKPILEQISDKNMTAYKKIKAQYFQLIGKNEEALALYNEIIASEKNPYATYFHKARLLSWMKRFEESVALFTRVIDAQVVSEKLRLKARIRRAEVYSWQKEFDRALQELDAVIQTDRDNTEARMIKAQILEWNGDYKHAKNVYKDILTIDEDHAQAKLKLQKLLWVE